MISIPKTDEQFRLLYDTKGRFVLHRITTEEAGLQAAACDPRVARQQGHHTAPTPIHSGQAGVIPYLVTHDGRTIRFADPAVKTNDTIKFDIATGKQVDQPQVRRRPAIHDHSRPQQSAGWAP